MLFSSSLSHNFNVLRVIHMVFCVCVASTFYNNKQVLIVQIGWYITKVQSDHLLQDSSFKTEELFFKTVWVRPTICKGLCYEFAKLPW